MALFELNKICLPSGLQVGVTCDDGSNVSLVLAPRASSWIQISPPRRLVLAWSTATLRPSCERRTMNENSGHPTVPTALPLRSNHVNRERDPPFPVCVTRTSPPETLKTARNT